MGAACETVHTRDGFRNLPLSRAALRGSAEEINLLLKAGADINAQGEHGYTALHEAVEQGHLDLVKLLIQWGADPSICNVNGDCATSLAQIHADEPISQLLKG